MAASVSPKAFFTKSGIELFNSKKFSVDEQLLAQGIKPLDLFAATIGVFCFATCTLREPAGQYGAHQEREQRNPILRVCDGEGVDWRKEEVVESQRRHNGRGRRERKPPTRGDKQTTSNRKVSATVVGLTASG